MTVKLVGRFDMSTRNEYLATVEKTKKADPSEIVIDLTEVSYIDSAGVGLLLVTNKECKASCIGFSLCLEESKVKQTLEFMKILDIIPLTAST